MWGCHITATPTFLCIVLIIQLFLTIMIARPYLEVDIVVQIVERGAIVRAQNNSWPLG